MPDNTSPLTKFRYNYKRNKVEKRLNRIIDLLEENGYSFQDTIYVDSDGDTLATPVAPEDAVEVHCGEEHDHDGHDH